MDTDLGPLSRFGIQFHLLMCSQCAQNKYQFEQTRHLAQFISLPANEHHLSTLTHDSKNSLKNAIRAAGL